MDIIENVKKSLNLPKFSNKLDEILKKNPAMKSWKRLGQSWQEKFPTSLLASVVSPCERAFSHFKDLLTNKRTQLTEEHLKDQMLIQWNKEQGTRSSP